MNATLELLSTMKSGVLSFSNIPDFDADSLAHWLGRRIVPTSGLPYAIAQHRDDPSNFSDRTEYFDWHSDGLYKIHPPRYVLLHCCDAGVESIPTEVVSIKACLDKISEDSLYTLGKLCSYYIGHNGNFIHPILSLKGMLLASRGFIIPLSGLSLLEQPSIRDISATLTEVYQLLDANAVPYHWKTGDTLVFDQYQYLHRRNSSVIDKQRKLIRMWFT